VAPLPFTQPEARAAFDVVLGLFVLLELRVRLRSSHNPSGSSVDQGSVVWVVVFIVAGVAGGFALARRATGEAIPDVRWPLFALGLALMGAGIAIRQWAVVALGRYFTVDVRVHPGQTVVDRGPYRWVRHPAYTGMIVAFVGIGVALGNWAALVVLLVVPTVGLVVRIHYEERALLDALGEPYRRFAASRPHLFPRLW